MRFGELTYQEVAAAAAADAVVVVPTGCTEQQGPHLAVDNDSWFSEAVLLEAARVIADEHQVLVLPVLPFGPTPEHRAFGAGYVDIPVAVYEPFVAAILDSLADQNFARILVWRGCGGHDLQAVVQAFNTDRDGSSRAFLPAQPFHDVWCSVADPDVPGGHADSFTTSIQLAQRPGRVRVERIPHDVSAQPNWSDPALDFSRYSTTGVIGTAAFASPELGRRLWDASVASVAEIMKRVARDPVEAQRPGVSSCQRVPAPMDKSQASRGDDDVNQHDGSPVAGRVCDL